jgi:hypothetical protein
MTFPHLPLNECDLPATTPIRVSSDAETRVEVRTGHGVLWSAVRPLDPDRFQSTVVRHG